MLILVLGLISATLLVIVAIYGFCHLKRSSKHDIENIENSEQKHEEVKEDLIIFHVERI
jgi:hypothetical protein